MNQDRSGLTLLELSFVLVVTMLLSGLLVPAINVSREHSRTDECLDRLEAIGRASQQYFTTHGSFPPGGCTFVESAFFDRDALAFSRSSSPEINQKVGTLPFLLPYLDHAPTYARMLGQSADGSEEVGAASQLLNIDAHGSAVLLSGGGGYGGYGFCHPDERPIAAWFLYGTFMLGVDTKHQAAASAAQTSLRAFLCPSDKMLNETFRDGGLVSWNVAYDVKREDPLGRYEISYHTHPDSIPRLLQQGYTTTELQASEEFTNTFGRTNYACVLGAVQPNPFWGEREKPNKDELYHRYEGICTNRSRTNKVIDGESNTLLFGEVTQHIAGSNLERDTAAKRWVAGEKMVYEAVDFNTWMATAGYGTTQAGIGGNRWTNRDDGIDNDLDILEYHSGRSFSSMHEGVTNFVLADGAVRSLSHEIEWEILLVLSGKDDFGIVDWDEIE